VLSIHHRKIISAGANAERKISGWNQQSRRKHFELTAAEFDQAFTHEFVAFPRLGHSQINVDVLLNAINHGAPNCSIDDNAGIAR